MEILDNLLVFGNIKTNNFSVKDTKTHSLTNTDTTYTINLEGNIKHIIDLQNAPTNVTLDISGGDENELMGVIVLKQSTASVKKVTWNTNNNLDFDSFSGSLGSEKIYFFHYNNNNYQNLSNTVGVPKSFTTTTASTTCSLDNTSYATLNISQNTAITFSDMKDGVVYNIIITQTGTNTVTFSNLLTASGTALTLSGNMDLIQITKNPSNTQAILVNKQLNLS